MLNCCSAASSVRALQGTSVTKSDRLISPTDELLTLSRHF